MKSATDNRTAVRYIWQDSETPGQPWRSGNIDSFFYRNSLFLSQICVRGKGEFRSHLFMANKTAISCLGNTG